MNKHLIFFLSAFTFMAIVSSCKKSNYLTDEGVHDAKTPLSTYDYLKANSWHSFDTLIMLVDRFQLKDEMNQAPTVFAVTNASISNYMTRRLNEKRFFNENAKYNLDSLYADLKADSIRQYFFDEEVTLANATEEPQPLVSMVNTKFGYFKQLQTTNTYTQYTSGQTYLLYLVKARGELDVPGTPPPINEIDVSVLCQTTGILPSSGGVLHVLANQHIFARF